MYHDRSSAPASGADPGVHSAFEAAHALVDLGIEQANLSKRLCETTRTLLLRAATDRDAADAGRTWSAFVDSMTRELSDNAELVSRIWRRYLREVARSASAQVPPDPFAAR